MRSFPCFKPAIQISILVKGLVNISRVHKSWRQCGEERQIMCFISVRVWAALFLWLVMLGLGQASPSPITPFKRLIHYLSSEFTMPGPTIFSDTSVRLWVNLEEWRPEMLFLLLLSLLTLHSILLIPISPQIRSSATHFFIWNRSTSFKYIVFSIWKSLSMFI